MSHEYASVKRVRERSKTSNLLVVPGVLLGIGASILLVWGMNHRERTVPMKGIIVGYRMFEEPWVEPRTGQGFRPRVLKPEYKVRVEIRGKPEEVRVPGKDSGMPDEIEKLAREKVGQECEFQWSEKWQSAVSGEC